MDKLSDFDPIQCELKIRDERTTLEKRTQNLRIARERKDLCELESAKSQLLEFVLANIGNAKEVDRTTQGRRYYVFSVLDCFVKIAVSEGRYSVLPPNRMDLEKLVHRNSIENAAIAHYFGESVPDALFYESKRQIAEQERLASAMNQNPFLIQAGVLNAVSIATAAKMDICQLDNFRRQLEAFLEKFVRMGDNLGYVPDIPRLDCENVLVNADGNVFMVDTNTLVTPAYYAELTTAPFNFVSSMEKLILSLEKGTRPE